MVGITGQVIMKMKKISERTMKESFITSNMALRQIRLSIGLELVVITPLKKQ